jgi:hypothetical protein
MFLSISKSIKKLRGTKLWGKATFVIIGILSTIWFLIRVIPKPQRATYPCMRAAAPFMSSFVIYLLTITGAAFLLKKFPKGFKVAQISLTALFFVIALAIPGISHIKEKNALAVAPALETPNTPMGVAKGINPGRVVWVFNPDATDNNFDQVNSNGSINKAGGYFMDKYTNQDEVDKMLNALVTRLTDKYDLKEAWNAIFKFHNKERGKGEVGYKAGEIIFLKINRTSSWGGNFNNNDLSRVTNNNNFAISETSPQVVTSVLRHLVNVVGVAQEDIYIGDPMKHMYKDDYEKWHGEFPSVNYLDIDRSTLGRTRVEKSSTAIIDYSDRGDVLRSGDWNDATKGSPIESDFLYTIFEDMEYMINLPTMKGHVRGGVTMFAKNHFGSHTRESALHLHAGLTNMGSTLRNQYGMYRVLVDIMGHELLGQKNLIYIMDALYSSEHEVNQPDKWQKAPWNNSWTSSMFISQDPVAIESVGFDFLYYEYDGSSGEDFDFPHYGAVDDYLHQAADKANWPAGIVYDPENDGTPIPSLGVHEHWNNPIDMQYSRNLGTGNGIELVKINRDNLTSLPNYKTKENFKLSVYPNPATGPSTIRFSLKNDASVNIRVVSLDGRIVYESDNVAKKAGSHNVNWDASTLGKGTYFLQLSAEQGANINTSTFKFQKL